MTYIASTILMVCDKLSNYITIIEFGITPTR